MGCGETNLGREMEGEEAEEEARCDGNLAVGVDREGWAAQAKVLGVVSFLGDWGGRNLERRTDGWVDVGNEM